MTTTDMSIEVHPDRPEPIVLDVATIVLHLTVAKAAQIRDALAEAIQGLEASS